MTKLIFILFLMISANSFADVKLKVGAGLGASKTFDGQAEENKNMLHLSFDLLQPVGEVWAIGLGIESNNSSGGNDQSYYGLKLFNLEYQPESWPLVASLYLGISMQNRTYLALGDYVGGAVYYQLNDDIELGLKYQYTNIAQDNVYTLDESVGMDFNTYLFVARYKL